MGIKDKKGSLTIEASIAFPLFLCFFLFLILLIRTACIHMILDHAVHETAKELAANSYPVALFNSLEDELIADNLQLEFPTYQEELGYIGQSLKNRATSPDFLSKLFSGGLKTGDITGMLGNIAENTAGGLADGVKGYLTRTFAGKYYAIKTKAKYAAAEYLMKKHCGSSFVNMEQIRFILVEVPQGEAEFLLKSRDPGYAKLYGEMQLAMDADNVIVAIEYTTRLSIPFLGEKTMTTRHISVEKAWTQGRSNIQSIGKKQDPQSDTGKKGEGESGGEENGNQTVYITRLGEKYHLDGCMYLARSQIPIRLEEAKARGYEPCKVCVLKTAKDWRK